MSTSIGINPCVWIGIFKINITELWTHMQTTNSAARFHLKTFKNLSASIQFPTIIKTIMTKYMNLVPKCNVCSAEQCCWERSNSFRHVHDLFTIHCSQLLEVVFSSKDTNWTKTLIFMMMHVKNWILCICWTEPNYFDFTKQKKYRACFLCQVQAKCRFTLHTLGIKMSNTIYMNMEISINYVRILSKLCESKHLKRYI